VRVKLQKFVTKRITVLAKIGKQKRMSWVPKNKAVVLIDLCSEWHTECIIDYLWSVNTTLLSLAESTVIFFSSVVKTYEKGYFRYIKKIDYNSVDIKNVQIIHSAEYVPLNICQ
jgi:hypothetical protein